MLTGGRIVIQLAHLSPSGTSPPHQREALACCLQHIFYKNAVAHGGIVHQHVGYSADEFAVLDDRRAGHARVNIGPTHFCIVRFQRFPVYKKKSHRSGAISLYDRSLNFYGVCYIRTNSSSDDISYISLT